MTQSAWARTCPPFASAILDLVQPGLTEPAQGAEVLSSAIAAEIACDAPSTTLDGAKRCFERLLRQLRNEEMSRDTVERAIGEIFAMAAKRDYGRLTQLIA